MPYATKAHPKHHVDHAELRPHRPRTSAARTSSLMPDALPYPIRADLGQMYINDLLVTDEIDEAVIDGEVLETMEGAATITLNISDRERTLIHDKILNDWVNVNDPVIVSTIHGHRRHVVIPDNWNDVYLTTDERDFALVQVNKSQDMFDLIFENRAINELRKYKSARTWNRGTYTRAMACKSMCDEVKGFHIPVYAPELHKIQPITSKHHQISKTERKKLKQHGFAPGAHLRIKTPDDVANAQQRDWIGRVISTGESLNAAFKVLVAALETIIQESDLKMLNDPATGIGLFSQIPADGWPATGSNVERDAKAFYDKAIPIYKQNPSIGTGALAQAVQRSGASPSGGLYQQWEHNAVEMLRQWGTSSHGGSVSYSSLLPYLFTRGKDGNPEDSWDCITRLMQEVNWRAFMMDNAMYLIDDETLINSMPYDTISEKDEGIDTIDYEIDTGKTVSQCTVTAHIDRWQCPAGSVCVVEDSGPANGRWLTHEVRRPIKSEIAEITLQLPSPPKPEPAPSTARVSLHGAAAQTAVSGNKGVDKVYAKAIEISNKNYPYVYGGGHSTIGVPDRGTGGGNIGYDCSGYVSACLHAAGWLSSPLDSGSLENWGQAGPGKLMTVYANAGHTFIHFSIPKGRRKVVYKRADTVPDAGGPDGPHVRTAWPPPEPDWSTMVARHWPGT